MEGYGESAARVNQIGGSAGYAPLGSIGASIRLSAHHLAIRHGGGMTTLQEQLTIYLTDAHSIEEQALQQLRTAPDIAGEPTLADVLRQHLAETEEQERSVRERLEAHGAAPSKVKDLVMRAGGAGFVLFAASQTDTPGKLTSHAFSYEHLELAAYELLMRVAERAGDTDTVELARRIRDQERAMGERLAGCFDVVVEASLQNAVRDDVQEHLNSYLADAHAIEAQAIQLLEKGPDIAGDPDLARIYSDHLTETREQQRLVEDRLHVRNSEPTAIKDAAMRLGALNWGMFFQAQPDTPGKLAAFAYAFEHLEIGGYEQLKRVAQRAGDDETIRVADYILEQERGAAERIASAFDRAVEASLEARGALG
jgi:ferritin-like metal-binding protein YciE